VKKFIIVTDSEDPQAKSEDIWVRRRELYDTETAQANENCRRSKYYIIWA